MLILTQYIAKHELKPMSRWLNIDDLLTGAKMAIFGLATEIKPPKGAPSYRFFKVRIGKGKLARMILFVVSGGQKAVPVLIRLKKDKAFGTNMLANNPKVMEQVSRNLSQIFTDIKEGNFEEFKF